eukprot:scaffold260890_cov19-Tisochrysis_lutea.AAC.1
MVHGIWCEACCKGAKECQLASEEARAQCEATDNFMNINLQAPQEAYGCATYAANCVQDWIKFGQ